MQHIIEIWPENRKRNVAISAQIKRSENDNERFFDKAIYQGL
jgi:hypothetical protein